MLYSKALSHLKLWKFFNFG